MSVFNFYWGLVLLASYILALLLPGIALFSIGKRSIIVTDLPAIVAISLLSNLLLAYIFVFLGIQITLTYYLLAVCYLLILFKSKPQIDLSLNHLLAAALVFASLFLAMDIKDAFLSIFQRNDAVFSWGRWTSNWAEGSFPEFTMNYPQLIPANWAAIQLFNGGNLEIFARTIMPLFVLFTLIAFFRTGTNKLHAFLSCMLYTYLVKTYYSDYISEGYVDIAVAFLSWSSVAISYNMIYRSGFNAGNIMLASLIATAAALTKQGGLLAVVFVQILMLLYHKTITKQTGNKWLTFTPLLTFCLMGSPFYLYKYYLIYLGQERDVTSFLIGEIHRGRNHLERIVHGWSLLYKNSSRVLVYSVAALCLVSPLFDRRMLINLGYVIATFFTWALFFSYDIRNLSVALPPITFAAAASIFYAIKLCNKQMTQKFDITDAFASKSVYAAIALLLTVLALLFSTYNLENHENAQIEKRGNPALNHYLQMTIAPSCRSCVLTNYRYMESNKNLKGYYFPQYRAVNNREDRPLRNEENFEQWLNDKRIQYVVFNKKDRFHARHQLFIEKTKINKKREFVIKNDNTSYIVIKLL